VYKLDSVDGCGCWCGCWCRCLCILGDEDCGLLWMEDNEEVVEVVEVVEFEN